jgi:hypothetical protein
MVEALNEVLNKVYDGNVKSLIIISETVSGELNTNTVSNSPVKAVGMLEFCKLRSMLRLFGEDD